MKKYLISLIISILPNLLSAQLPWSTPQLLCDSIGSNTDPSFVKSGDGFVGSNILVWSRDFGNYSGIYLKDFADPDSEIAVNSFAAGGFSQKPTASYNNYHYPYNPDDRILIVWQSNQNGNFDLYSIVYDNGYFSDYQQITNDISDDINPDLAGDFLVWERDSSIYTAEYSFSDSVWSNEFKVDSLSCSTPVISWTWEYPLNYSPLVVYQKEIGNTYQICAREKQNNQTWITPENISQVGDNQGPVFCKGIDGLILWSFKDNGDWNLKSYTAYLGDTTSFNFSPGDEFNPCGTFFLMLTDQTFGPTFLAFESNVSGDTEVYSHDWPGDYDNSYNISQHYGPDINPTLSYPSSEEATIYNLRVRLVWVSEENNHWQIVSSYTELQSGKINNEQDRMLNSFNLRQNYPNPFNSGTTIEFDLPKASEIEVSIYNLLGQKVRTIWNGRHPAGQDQLHWDGRDETGGEVASGVYIYQLVAGKYRESRKMLLLR